jgi:uncharacterized protein
LARRESRDRPAGAVLWPRYVWGVTIYEIVWPADRVEHIARHGITPTQFEEVCFGNALVLKAKREGKNPVYHVLGRTVSGDFLLCIVIAFPDGRGYPVTARPMKPNEERRYQRWSTT